MHVFGITAEYNPFHSGHALQIRATRERLGDPEGRNWAVAAVLSGNWVQQGAPALADKWLRTRLALRGGVDLVLELPTAWACSSAESFARGAVTLLERTGVVEAISFGSECGDLEALREVAAALDSPAWQDCLRRRLESGATFAACRQGAIEELLGREKAALLASPNNTLGIEYLRALNRLGSSMIPVTVRRAGARHNAPAGEDAGVSKAGEARLLREEPLPLSATAIREELVQGHWEQMKPYLPPGGRNVLEGHMISPAAREKMEWAMLAKIRGMTPEDWSVFPDAGEAEGLPRRLERCARTCGSIGAFLEQAKTKRYPRARLVRLLMRAWLDLPASATLEEPHYLRVLGFNERGREILRGMKKTAKLPVLIRPVAAKNLPEPGRALFQQEARCTDLYDMLLEPVPPAGREWRSGPVLPEEAGRPGQ